MKIFILALLVCLFFFTYVVFRDPLYFSDDIKEVQILGSGEATEKTFPKSPKAKFDIIVKRQEIPTIKLGMKKSFGAMIRIQTENKKPTLVGAAFIQPDENPKKRCNNLINSKANFFWQWIAKYYPVPRSMYEDGSSISQLWKFDSERELKPGIWTIRFCGKTNEGFVILHDFKFQMIK